MLVVFSSGFEEESLSPVIAHALKFVLWFAARFNSLLSTTVTVLPCSLLTKMVVAKAGEPKSTSIVVSVNKKRVRGIALAELALALRLVIAERVGEIFWVQESLLWRNGDDVAGPSH